MTISFSKRISLFGFVTLVLCLGFAPVAQALQPTGLAETQSCGGDGSFTALYKAPVDSYDLYVKLGQQSQTAPIDLHYQPLGAARCALIGSVVANGQSWVKVGSMDATQADSPINFTLSSQSSYVAPGANRPTVMLVSKTNPICAPAAECSVQISGQQAVLRATGTLLNEDTLHVVTAKDPSSDEVVKVNYYVDNKLAYSLPTVQAFDMRYVSSGKHTLATVVDYKSKQQALIKKDVKQPYYDDLSYYTFRLIHEQRNLLTFAVVFIAGLVVVEMVLLGLHYLHRRRVWRNTHYAKALPVDEQGKTLPLSLAPSRPKVVHAERLAETIKRVSLFGVIIIGALAVVVVINSWVLQPYKVDGPSMQSTLFTGNTLAVDKTRKTFARLSNRQYTPTRGQVVVFVKQKNVVFESTEAEPPTFVVKRVIGLPGERVVVKGAVITVYNSASPSGFNPDINHPWTKTQHPGDDDTIDITLQPDELFLVGDNRPESIDSRVYGPVKIDEIVGRAIYKVTPIGKGHKL